MVESLVDENWSIAGTSVTCHRAKALPDLITNEFDANLVQEYLSNVNRNSRLATIRILAYV